MKQSTIAALRFGCGLGPRPGPATPEAVLAALAGPDPVRDIYPLMTLAQASDLRTRFSRANADERKGLPGAEKTLKPLRRAVGLARSDAVRAVIARMLDSPAPLRERLNLFWLDHFTAHNKAVGDLALVQPFIEAIRTTQTLRFADMLRAVMTQPLMLAYLDQTDSVGPNSRVGRKRKLGLNENLAREMLELHTLGIGGAYSQADVRQLAELLTGLRLAAGPDGFAFQAAAAEPGTETVLGRDYGGRRRGGLESIFDALEDLSVHPDTSRHIARKLAVHFVADDPDPALVDHLAARWRATDGDLLLVYGALLDHPAAWTPVGAKVRQPQEFVAAALIALGVTGAQVVALPRPHYLQMIERALASMGQPFLQAPGPDGWPEQAEAWVTPQALAPRIRWAMRNPERLVRPLPDPRDFAVQALDDAASQGLRQTVARADTVAQGVGLVLASPEFNRR